MSRVDGEPCFILHQRAYRETSALLEIFSVDHGRLSTVARGLRGSGRSRQGWRSSLQPFNLVGLSWAGRGELKTLTGVELQKRYDLQGRALFCGIYLNELLERLLHRSDPHPTLFHHYQYALTRLLKGEEAVSLRHFEFALLAELGYGFSFSQAADGAPIVPERFYRYEWDRGFVSCGDNGGPGHRGADLLRLAKGDLSGGAEAAARRLNSMAIRQLLGGRPLRSRDLFSGGLRGASIGEEDG